MEHTTPASLSSPRLDYMHGSLWIHRPLYMIIVGHGLNILVLLHYLIRLLLLFWFKLLIIFHQAFHFSIILFVELVIHEALCICDSYFRIILGRDYYSIIT